MVSTEANESRRDVERFKWSGTSVTRLECIEIEVL